LKKKLNCTFVVVIAVAALEGTDNLEFNECQEWSLPLIPNFSGLCLANQCLSRK
jgi:hypothetical protein